MRVFKLAATLSVLAPMVFATAAHAGALTKFGTSTDEDFTYNSSTGNFNVTGGSIPDFLQTSNLGLGGYNVVEQVNGGNGVTVTSATDINGTTALTLGAFTLTYMFATPQQIGNVYVTDLLTLTVGAGTVFDYSDAGQTAFWNFSLHAGNSVTFASDILQFRNVVDEAVTFSFSSVDATNGANGLGGLDAQGSGNFSSNPLPAIPEPVSLAMLVIGMTAVGVASRKRGAAAV